MWSGRRGRRVVRGMQEGGVEELPEVWSGRRGRRVVRGKQEGGVEE